MARVAEGVQQADRDGLGGGVADRRDDAVDLVVGQRDHHLPVVVEPFGHLDDPAAGHHGVGAGHGEVVQGRAVLPADHQQVPEPGGGDQQHVGAVALEHRVGGHRRAVREAVEPARLDLELGHPGEDPLGLVGRGRRHLGHPDLVADHEHEVGEGAPDVDAQCVARRVRRGHGRP